MTVLQICARFDVVKRVGSFAIFGIPDAGHAIYHRHGDKNYLQWQKHQHAKRQRLTEAGQALSWPCQTTKEVENEQRDSTI